MKRLKHTILIFFVLLMSVEVFAAKKDDKGIEPDSPIVTSWSKIKELFE